MNKELSQFFNNGENDGLICFHCQDNKIVRCHDFVIRLQSEFGKSKFNFNSMQKKDIYDIDMKKLLK